MSILCEVTCEIRQHWICVCFLCNPFSKSEMGPTLRVTDPLCWIFAWSGSSLPSLKRCIAQQCWTLRWISANCSLLIILSSARWYLNLVLFQFAKVFPEVVCYCLKEFYGSRGLVHVPWVSLFDGLHSMSFAFCEPSLWYCGSTRLISPLVLEVDPCATPTTFHVLLLSRWCPLKYSLPRSLLSSSNLLLSFLCSTKSL